MMNKKEIKDRMTLGCKDCDEKGCVECNYTGQIPFTKKKLRKQAREVIKNLDVQPQK